MNEESDNLEAIIKVLSRLAAEERKQLVATGRFVTLDDIAALPPPTETQCERFITHLADVHSWYKHLPLLGGGEFIVFLDPRAGRVYPLEHPRLPDVRPGETNTEEAYLKAFGHLSYLWRVAPSEEFDTDCEQCPIFDRGLADIGRFNLYPYVSCEFYWSMHEDAVKAIRQGVYHPQAQLILQAYEADAELEAMDRSITPADAEVLHALDENDDAVAGRPGLPQAIKDYISCERRCCALMDALREPELAKIRNHVTGLLKWHAAIRR